MKLVGRLSRRVVLVAVVSGLSGVAIALFEARTGFRRALAESVRDELDDGEARRCAARPEAWSLRGPGEARTFAYDARTLASKNPAAPPLDEELLRSLDAAGDGVAWADRVSGGGRIVLRVAEGGPCSVLQIAWPGRAVVRESVGVVAWAGGVTVLTAALLGLVLVVWPLGRRTGALRDAAARLGEGTGHEAKEPASGDELDLVLAGLVAGDARIRADAARLEAQSHALERHLADVAHDLRTPLASMQLAIEQAADASESEAARGSCASALGDCVYLSGLTENLRMKSLIEEGWAPQIAAEPVDLAPIVERISTRARALARRRGVAVEYALPDERVAIRCDAIAFERALGNIVDNAVAYGEKGGHVAVTLSAEGEGFVVKVLDDGPGVAAEDLPRLAERAFRADAARRRDARGSGLGLSITAEICARSGFTLRFAPLAPRGLEVSLRGPSGGI